MAEQFNPSSESSEGKFNFALKTLEAIDNILNKITDVSVNYNIADLQQLRAMGKAQHAKYFLVKQFYIRAIPLMDTQYIPEIKKKLENIQLGWKPNGSAGKHIKINANLPVPESYVEAYYPDTNNQLDLLIEDIEISLQKYSKLFMPPKGEKKMF